MNNKNFRLVEQFQLMRDEPRTGLEKALWTGVDYDHKGKKIGKPDVIDYVRGELANNCFTGSDGRANLSTREVPGLEQQISNETGRKVAILFAGMANVHRINGEFDKEKEVIESLRSLERIRFSKGFTFENKEVRKQKAQKAIYQLNEFFGVGEKRNLPADEDQRMKDIVAYHFMKNA